MSIDIGKKHYALYIEDVDEVMLFETFNEYVKKVDPDYKHKKNSRSPFSKLTLSQRLDLCRDTGKAVLLELVDLTDKKWSTPLKGLPVYAPPMKLQIALSTFLRSHHNILSTADVVIIEQQRQVNGVAMKLAAATEQYFTSTRLGDIINGKFRIQSVPPREKLEVFDMVRPKSKKKSDKAHKHWSVEMAIGLIKEREDEYCKSVFIEHSESLEQTWDENQHKLRAKDKADDIADAIMQLQGNKLARVFEISQLA